MELLNKFELGYNPASKTFLFKYKNSNGIINSLLKDTDIKTDYDLFLQVANVFKGKFDVSSFYKSTDFVLEELKSGKLLLGENFFKSSVISLYDKKTAKKELKKVYLTPSLIQALISSFEPLTNYLSEQRKSQRIQSFN